MIVSPLTNSLKRRQNMIMLEEEQYIGEAAIYHCE